MLKCYFISTVLISMLSYAILNWEDVNKFVRKYITLDNENLHDSNEKLFTVEELKKYNSDVLYLAVLGQVFDVTKGKKHYGPGQSYHGFTGKDGSKAFISGDFSDEGLTDDVSELSLSDLGGLKDWLDLYHKDYIYKGNLIGRFYDKNGKKTTALEIIEKKLETLSAKNKQEKELEQKYPPCNMEWNQENGSRVWCSTRSGGIARDWIGVPRKLYLPGQKSFRCACIQLTQDGIDVHNGNIELYKGCDPISESCFVIEN